MAPDPNTSAQAHRDSNGSRIATQIGVEQTFSNKEDDIPL